MLDGNMAGSINIAHQAFILARLAEFTQYKSIKKWDSDPWAYMRTKLHQIEPELTALKTELLAATCRRTLRDLRAGTLGGEACSDFKVLFEKLLGRGDFVDVAMHLDSGAGTAAAAALEPVFARLKPHHVFEELRQPADRRDPNWTKLLDELTRRLEIDGLEKILKRKKLTQRRKMMVLRRLRRNVAEYCTVVRIPTNAEDTFTPFMLPRVEALIGAALRFLDRYR